MTKMPKITPAVTAAANAYLQARALAETQRARVDAIARQVLDADWYSADPIWSEKSNGHIPSGRVTDPADTYLLEDVDARAFFIAMQAALVADGFTVEKVDGGEPHDYKCPALVAESLQHDAERLVVEATAEMLGYGKDFYETLTCSSLENYHKFIDLAVRLVIAQPGYKAPSVD